MAHTIAVYTAAAGAASAAYTALTDSGYFDSVTLDDSTNTVTYTLDGETVFTIQYSSGRVDWTFGVLTEYATQVSAFWISLCDSAVFVGFNGYPGRMYTLALYKSKNGRIMFTYRNAYSGTVKHLCDDTAVSPSGESNTITNNAFYSTACPVCSINGIVDAVSVSQNVYRFVDRYSGISDSSLSMVQIGDESYLTDSYLCMKTT